MGAWHHKVVAISDVISQSVIKTTDAISQTHPCAEVTLEAADKVALGSAQIRQELSLFFDVVRRAS